MDRSRFLVVIGYIVHGIVIDSLYFFKRIGDSRRDGIADGHYVGIGVKIAELVRIKKRHRVACQVHLDRLAYRL